MKLLLTLSVLFASAAQAAPLTIWSCSNASIAATITTDIRMKSPEQGGPAVTYLTVTGNGGQVLNRMVVEPLMLIQMEGRKIEAAYAGRDARMSVKFTVLNKPTRTGGYASKIVYKMDGDTVTKNVACFRTRSFAPPVYPQ